MQTLAHRRFTFLTLLLAPVGLLLLAQFALRSVSAQTATNALTPVADTSPLTETPPTPPRRRLIDESEIRELDRIRNRLGISPLRGSLLEDVPLPDQQEAGSPFAHQLRAEFGSDLAGHATAAMEGTVTGTAGTVAGRPNAGRTSPESLEYRRRSLRSLGRRLDALAHDFEELELFDEADQLRTISSEIRHKNRNP